MQSIPVTPPVCANWKDGGNICPREGTHACRDCKLVLYCGRDCQIEHWNEHKKSCKSSLMKPDWLPAWDREGRDPAWARGEAATNFFNSFGMEKHLWGNTPAMDVLQLHKNEGIAYGKDLAIMFAASGDLRNVVETIQSLPDQFDQQVKLTINDKDFSVVARNVVLLLFALTSLDKELEQISAESLAESLIHVWYSAMITEDILSRLQSSVKPLIEEVCQKISNKSPGVSVGKTWSFKSGSTLRLVLKKEDWARVLSFLEVPEHLSASGARAVRHAIVLAPERQDYRERWYFKDATPSMRVAKQRFREDGLLLPFGHPRLGFNCPNPTIFQAADSWPLNDQANPMNGWPPSKVRATPYRAAEDLYGRFFSYLRTTFTAFIKRVATVKMHFELFNVDAMELYHLAEKGVYDRVETSNISDVAYLGTYGTIRCLSPFLKPPQISQYATLITIYMNAVMEAARFSGELEALKGFEDIFDYLPVEDGLGFIVNSQGAKTYRVWDARALILDADTLFGKYMTKLEFHRIAEDLRVKMKEHNTIGDPWPTRLKLRLGEPGAKEEFLYALSSSFIGAERCVEWKRTE